MSERLSPGDHAPDFQLSDQHGTTRSLVEFRGAPLLVFFYPKANTSGCTDQACGLRDAQSAIGRTQIVGISPDEPKVQAKWDDKHHFGFPLLSDPDHAVADAYGVWGPKKLYGRDYEGIIRSAFLVSPEGVIEDAWYKVSPKNTVTNLLEASGQ